MSTIEKILTAARMILDARRRYGVGLLSVIHRFMVAWRRKFSPIEISQLELLNTKSGHRSLDDFISNEELLRIQAALNPVSLHDETEDKKRFYRRCAEHGFPIPATVAEIASGHERSATTHDAAYDGEDFLARLCATLGEGDYILKPANGYHGEGIAGFCIGTEPADRRTAGGEIARHLDRFPQFDSWLLQERLKNHGDVLALSPSEALQTIRIVTCVDGHGNVSVLAAQWRLAGRDACIDNFNGASRGLLCNIIPETGLIETCWRQKKNYPREFGFEVHQSHPATGQPLVGRKVPFWEDAVDLASRAATAFLPARAIGWDVAVSDRGVVLIEGNRLWDPHNEDARMGERVRRLTAQLAAAAGALKTASP